MQLQNKVIFITGAAIRQVLLRLGRELQQPGHSIGQHVLHCRADLAKTLLTQSASIQTVAARLGFKSAGNFSQAFRRATGESPGEYRQRLCGRVD